MSIVGINGVYAPNQKIIKGDKGNDFNIDDYSDGLHIINIPTASPTSRGLLSAADYVFFSGGASPVLNSGSIWIGSVTNTPVPQIMSGDATISNTGVLTLNANVVRTTGSYADPVWITSLSGSKITGNITGNAANVTGIVPLTNGGSGANTAAGARANFGLVIGTNVQAWSANLDSLAAFTADLDPTLAANSDSRLSSQKAIKAYVDNMVAGLKWKQAVRVATTTNGTLATAFQNGSVVDGVALVTGDRILLKNQTTQTENGIYTVNATGAPTRSLDADMGSELVQATMFVTEGTVNMGTQWTCTNNTITLGVTNITFAQVSGPGTYVAGDGMSLSGNQFSVDATVARLTATQTLSNKTIDNTNLITVKDSNFTLQDDVDITKQAQFSAGTISPATNRTYILPNADGTLALTSDLHAAVTKVGENYITLTGQQITANPVDLSGTNATGTLAAARFPALSGDVATTAGSLTTTIGNNAVTFAKMQDIPTASLIGRNTAGSGDPETLTTLPIGIQNNITQTGTVTTGTWTANITKIANLTTNGFVKTSSADGTLVVDTNTYITANQNITLSGDVTGSGTTAISTTIAAQAVTLPKIQNVATATLLGRNTAGTGSLEVLTTIPTAVQNNITQVGTITSGVWTGTAIAVANGGTGATTAANARTNLGLGSFSTVSSNSIMTGYVQIGDDAAVPLEKHRTITGTTANSQGNQVFVTHGCPDPTKIISIRTFVDLGGGSNIYITSGYRYSTGYEFSERVSNTEIVISNVTGNSGNILNLPFKTLIIYRQ